MKVGSLFTGIGGFDKAFQDVGATIAWQCEIDKFCLKVLEKHFPKAKRYTDVTKLEAEDLERVDVLCGGFPCQDLSVAGKRAGLAGGRSSLFFEFARLADALKPQWLVVENVPGLLSSASGKDFRIVVNTLADLGYGLAWRTLDSQYFGVPQRRNRIFIVGHLGKPVPPSILFEPESLQRDIAKSRKAPGEVAGTLDGGAHPGGYNGQDAYSGNIVGTLKSGGDTHRGWNVSAEDARDGMLIAQPVAGTLAARDAKGADNIYAEEGKLVSLPVTMIKGAAIGREPENGPQYGDTRSDGNSYTLNTAEVHAVVVPTLNASGSGTERPGGQGAEPGFYVPTAMRMREGKEGGGKGPLLSEDKSLTLASGNDQSLFTGYGVRRLTPTECERLQAFPDGWTDIPLRLRDKKAEQKDLYKFADATFQDRNLFVWSADGPRYRALGNAVTVSVVRWIAERIVNIHQQDYQPKIEGVEPMPSTNHKQEPVQLDFLPPIPTKVKSRSKSNPTVVKDTNGTIKGNLPPVKPKPVAPEPVLQQQQVRVAKPEVVLPPRPSTIPTPLDRRLLQKDKVYQVQPDLIVHCNCSDCGHDITKDMVMPSPGKQYKLHGYAAITKCMKCFTENTFDMVILYPADGEMSGRGIQAQQNWMKEVGDNGTEA